MQYIQIKCYLYTNQNHDIHKYTRQITKEGKTNIMSYTLTHSYAITVIATDI